MSVALFGDLQLALVHLKRERLTGDRLARWRNLNLHKPEGAAGLFLGGADAQQQPITLGQAPAHHPQLAQQASQSLAPHGDLFLLPSFALGQHVEFTLMLVQLHLYRVAHLLPRQFQPLLFMLVDPTFGRAHQIESLPLRLAHLLQDRFARNAAIHHPYPPRFAISVLDLLKKAPQCGAVRCVTVHHFIGQRKPIRRDHQRNHQLQTIRSFIPAVATFGFPILLHISPSKYVLVRSYNSTSKSAWNRSAHFCFNQTNRSCLCFSTRSRQRYSRSFSATAKSDSSNSSIALSTNHCRCT